MLSSLFALTLSATGRQPMVTVNSSNDYEIKIDRTTYNGNNTIPNLNQGTHSVQVYQVKKGLLGKRRTLVSSSSFELRNNDVNISVDNGGQLRINESGDFNNTRRRDRSRESSDRDNRNRDRDINDDRDHDDDDDYRYKKTKKTKHNKGHNNSHNGNGKKKGHYKNHGDNDD